MEYSQLIIQLFAKAEKALALRNNEELLQIARAINALTDAQKAS